jgi:tetratricopeptide (TPR) repeat protein
VDLGKRLRRLRVERDLSQAQIAEPDYTSSYVSTIEAGKRQPSDKALAHFAAKLGVDVDELRTGRSAGLEAQLEAEFAEARRLLSSDVAAGEKAFTALARNARRWDLDYFEGKAIYGLGLVAEASNDFASALAHHEKAEGILEADGLGAGTDALSGRARCLQAMQEVNYAVHLLEKRLDVFRHQGFQDPSAELRIFTSLVAAYFQAGLSRKAAEAAQRAEALGGDSTDPERLANMHINAARVLLEQRKWRAAQRHYVLAEDLYRRLDYRADLGRVSLARGFGLRMEGKLEQARAAVDQARGIFLETGNASNEARALVQLGWIERALGEVDSAELQLRRALKLLTEGEQVVKGMAQRELALCHAAKDRPKAVREMRKAIAILEEAEQVNELAVTYRALGDLLSEDVDLAPACNAYRTAALTYEGWVA